MILRRSIHKELYASLFLIAMVLLAILITNQFVNYVNQAANGRISMLAVFKDMLLQMPMLLVYLLPLSCYLSILVVLGRLCVDSEFSVMQACGMSMCSLVRIILSFSVLVMLLIAWLMIYAEPVLESLDQFVIAESTANITIGKILPRRFTDVLDGNVVYASSIDHDTQSLSSVFFAQKQAGAGSWRLTVADGARQVYDPIYAAKFIVFDNNVCFPILSKGLGTLNVIGFNRFPKPAASIMAFLIIIYFSKC